MNHEDTSTDLRRPGAPASKAPPVRQVYDELLAGFRASAGQEAQARWHWLEAAHVVGQMDLRLHWDSHGRMLAYAFERRDWPEAAGQVFRLALVPLGHALGRLPVGNIGRATVNAFRPMAVAAPVRERIAQARARAGFHAGAADTGLPA